MALHKAVGARARASQDGAVTRRRERRAYLCSFCNGWHLTSEPLRLDVQLGLVAPARRAGTDSASIGALPPSAPVADETNSLMLMCSKPRLRHLPMPDAACRERLA